MKKEYEVVGVTIAPLFFGASSEMDEGSYLDFFCWLFYSEEDKK